MRRFAVLALASSLVLSPIPYRTAAATAADSVAAQDARFLLASANAHAWDGQYAEAERTYVLAIAAAERRSDNGLASRAWAGLGSLYKWSERKVEALDCFERALRLQPHDTELRASWHEMRAQAGLQESIEGELVFDSAGFSGRRTRARLRAGDARRFAPLLTATYDRAGRRDFEDDVGASLAGGGRAFLGGGWTGLALFGVTRTDGGTRIPSTELTLSRKNLTWPSFEIAYGHAERGFDLRSFAARRARLRGHEVRFSSYKYLGSERGVWFGLRAGELSDGNRYTSLVSGFETRPTSRLLATADLYAIDYARRSNLYYAPSREWSAGLRLQAQAWCRNASQADIAVSWGRAGNSWTEGNALGLQARMQQALTAQTRLQARIEYTESLQSARYIARSIWLEVRHEGTR